MDKQLYEKAVNDLRTFLTTGQLGNLSKQPTVNEVEKLLGEPLALERKPKIVPNDVLLILYYENLQFTYIGEEFYQVAIYFREYAHVKTADKLPDGLGVVWYQIAKHLNYENFKQFLISQRISCRKVLAHHPTQEDGYAIEVTTTGIMAVFNDEPSTMIDSIFYTPSRRLGQDKNC